MVLKKAAACNGIDMYEARQVLLRFNVCLIPLTYERITMETSIIHEDVSDEYIAQREE